MFNTAAHLRLLDDRLHLERELREDTRAGADVI